MEPDDIGVVMTRANELHASICDAIDRVASQSRFHGSSPFAAPDDVPQLDAGVFSSSTDEEVRSLEGIREALEVLETQLESLQSVQQQQRLRKDAALAELEESRRVLLLRLKEHEGREMQVVEEAMTFAGEPVKKTDDLPLPPYLHPVSPSLYSESPVFRSAKPSLAKQLDERGSFNSSLFLVDETASETEAGNTMGNPAEMQAEQATSPPAGGLSRAFTGMLNFTGKTLLVVVSVVAYLAVSEWNRSGREREKEAKLQASVPVPSQAPAATAATGEEEGKGRAKAESVLECPAGYKQIEDEGVVKCVVKERVELPFPRGLDTPDVLHGRG
jgi:hypothetical protein